MSDEIKIEIKELEVAQGAAESALADPGLMEIVTKLAQRVDELAISAEQNGQQPFIRAEERPEVGGAAAQAVVPPSRGGVRRVQPA